MVNLKVKGCWSKWVSSLFSKRFSINEYRRAKYISKKCKLLIIKIQYKCEYECLIHLGIFKWLHSYLLDFVPTCIFLWLSGLIDLVVDVDEM